jgi:hypothetical protein
MNGLMHKAIYSLFTEAVNNVKQAFSISGPRASSGQRNFADWPDNGLYPWLIKFPEVSSNFRFKYSLEYN